MTESEKARFGASAMVRYVSGINRPIYPIAFIKYKMAIGISPAVCCFSTAGRKKIHDMLEVDMTLFSGLREHLPDAHSMESPTHSMTMVGISRTAVRSPSPAPVINAFPPPFIFIIRTAHSKSTAGIIKEASLSIISTAPPAFCKKGG